MANINYGSSPAGYSLTTTGDPVSAPGMGQDYSFFMRLAQKRMDDQDKLRRQEMEDRALDMDRKRLQLQAQRKALTSGTMAAPSYDPLAALRQSAEAEKLQAMITPPQRQLSYAGGSAGFYTQDGSGMNAYQRQAYLPNNASITDPDQRVKSATNTAEQDLAEEAAWRAARQQADEAKQDSYGRSQTKNWNA